VSRTRRQTLGQHFLVDDALAERIIGAVGATAADLVCEIGAGPGILTGRLAERAGRLVALEIDPALHRRLSTRAAAGAAVDVRLTDARTFPYETLAELRPDPAGRVLVVGNLPYAASKAILLRLFEARASIHALTLMLQREVAERLVAGPGGRVYGALSVLWQLWADLALLERVPPGAFRPPPAVHSSIVRLVPHEAPPFPIADPGRFAAVVARAFGQRRKTLRNSLRQVVDAAGFEATGIDAGRRAETLSPEEFAQLAATPAPAPL